MCRMLAVQSDRPVNMEPWTRSFAQRCQASREFQGHGWGVAWWSEAGWRRYRSLSPIWEDSFVVPSSSRMLIHARSAFRDEGIEVGNNMPFLDGDLAFAFNGELHGVRLAVPGATGAARLFHLFRRFTGSSAGEGMALKRLDGVVTRRSRYVRALNIIVADGRDLHVSTRFNEDQEYFTLHAAAVRATRGSPAMYVVGSEPVRPKGLHGKWRPLPNGFGGTLSAHAGLRSWNDGWSPLEEEAGEIALRMEGEGTGALEVRGAHEEGWAV